MNRSSIESRIRQQLANYLMGNVSFAGFSNWFAPILWSIEEYQNPAAEELAYEIALRLVEFSNGHWTESELHSLLEIPLRTYYYHPMATPMSYETSLDSNTKHVGGGSALDVLDFNPSRASFLETEPLAHIEFEAVSA